MAKCPPKIPHWHGASPDEEFVQVAVTGRQNGPTQWLDPVTDEEYHSVQKPDADDGKPTRSGK